jgi:hypothetical protein
MLVAGLGLWWRSAYIDFPPIFHRQAPYVGLTLGLGAFVGGSELVSRYRDEPVQVLTTTAGIVYALLNGLVSALVYGLLVRYGAHVLPGIAKDRLMMAIASGFGAMAILRSKFFTLRTPGGEDISIGPDAAVQAFLSVADRSVDRLRAELRLRLVVETVAEVKHPERGTDFLRVSLAAFQNLSDQEKSVFSAVIDDVLKKKYPPALTLQAIAYGLLNLSGERDFREFMKHLRDYSEEPPPGA